MPAVSLHAEDTHRKGIRWCDGLFRTPGLDTKSIIAYDVKYVKDEMTPEQCRAARGLIGWSQSQLGEKAALSLPTIQRFETQRGGVSGDAVSAMRTALEKGGVIFLESNGHGPGVRLRDPIRPDRARIVKTETKKVSGTEQLRVLR